MINNRKKLPIIIVLILLFICVFSEMGFAHSLSIWNARYPASSANTTYSFGINDYMHIDGKNVSYYWHNNTTKSYFENAIKTAFSTSWKNLITGTEVTSYSNAHLEIQYDPTTQPTNIAAVTTNYYVNGTTYHYSTSGTVKPSITFYYNSKNYTDSNKRILAAHELGHLWGLADLYNYNETLSSIYSHSYDFTYATRHDRNAMRIALKKYWFNPGNNNVWRYQYSPGHFRLRGDIDGDGNITSADSQLALRYSVDLETFSSLQKKVADVDGDGVITTTDAQLIMQYATGLISKFPTDT